MLAHMAGRPIKEYMPIYEPITMRSDDFVSLPFGDILVLCPVCHSSLVGQYGFQTLKTGTWAKYQCKNPLCPALQYLRKGRQFTLQTSAFFQDALADHLAHMLVPLVKGDSTQKVVGEHHHRSPALMTYIHQKIQAVLERRQDLEKLVVDAPLDDAVSLDEWFLKIGGEAVYVIMATSYGKKKVLGVKVAYSRDDAMMRAVFDEAERNNGKPFSTITIDAWGGSIKMAKGLCRPITAVIHRHKAPFDKAVLLRIEYIEGKRVLNFIGVKTDFFKARKSREYKYMIETEDLTKSTPKKQGRPKGSKNGQGKGPYKKIPKKDQKKRGPKGAFMVFDKGKKGYAKVDPGRGRVRLGKGGSSTVGAVLNQVISLFGKMTIQNNLAENKNSVVEHRVWRSGPKDAAGFEKRLRTFLFYLNNPAELPKLRIPHRLRGDLVYTELKTGLYGRIYKANYLFRLKLEKMGVLN